MKNTTNLMQGDCLEKLKDLADNSVDSIVTDPPAGISFLGKIWDSDKGGRDHWIAWKCEIAKECLRVLKPGGHALVWALPRTAHWTTTAWENAGFEVRDILAHIFSTGFPKSHNIGKSVEKLQGNEREDLGKYIAPDGKDRGGVPNKQMDIANYKAGDRSESKVTKGNSPFEGWGTGLKPAREDYILLRKPFKGTVASNVLEWGTGGINIDKSRVEATAEDMGDWDRFQGHQNKNTIRKNMLEFRDANFEGRIDNGVNPQGRFPANIIHDGSEEVLAVFPDSKGFYRPNIKNKSYAGATFGGGQVSQQYNDQGSASRFFYCAKPSKSERNTGLEGFEEKRSGSMVGNVNDGNFLTGSGNPREGTNANFHPTVKAIKLMSYLCNLITPPKGIILDPFMGSGSTGVSAVTEGFHFIGIELDKDYFEIAKARIENAKLLNSKYII